MAFPQASLPSQFSALIALSSNDYSGLMAWVETSIVGPQVGNYALACAGSHVLELTLRGASGGGVGPMVSLSALDTSISWAAPDQSGPLGWWKSTNWGMLFLASRQTIPQSLMLVCT